MDFQNLVPSDILILGDSFAAWRDCGSDWPVVLLNKLTGTVFDGKNIPRGRGFPGASWWSTRNLLLEELKISVPKILVICHTEETRIPNDDNIGFNASSISKNSVTLNDGISGHANADQVKAATLYLKYLYSYNFHKWAQLAWYQELDDILEENKIPITIHLHCFDNMNFTKTPVYKFKNGMTSKEILCELSMARNGSLSEVKLRNHFTSVQNLALANALYKTITTNYKSSVVEDLKLLSTPY
jgi:hypothetical protein